MRVSEHYESNTCDTVRDTLPPQKTGWPPPALMQDDHRGLFRWFASQPDARRLVREGLENKDRRSKVRQTGKE